MLLRTLLATSLVTSVGTGLAAQDVRLCERVEGPMVYVSIDAGAADAATSGRSPLLALLAETPASFDDAAAAGAVGFLRGVLARATGEVELALLGVAPAGLADTGGGGTGLPLVVVRTRLAGADAARMREVLADPRVATPMRTVHGHPTWALRGADRISGVGAAEAGAAAGTGNGAQRAFAIEAAVVGDDLVVANHARGLEEALDASTATRRTLVRDERYRRLVAQLRPAAGALVVFADWQRFGPRLATVGGLPGELLGWSGLLGADAVAAAVTPHAGSPDALQSVVLLSFPAGAPDGWLGLVEPAPARQLLDDVPLGGLGGCVFAVEPRRLGEVATRGAGFASRVRGGCGAAGIDLDRITRRLGQRGSLQLLLPPLLPGADPAPVFALQTQSRKHATDIVGDLRRALGDAATPKGGDRAGGDRAGGDRAGGDRAAGVELRHVGLEHLRLDAVDDWLVFSQRAEAAAALQAANRDRARARPQLEAAFGQALRAFGVDRGHRLAGVLHVDATALAADVGPAAEPRSQPARTGWPVRHTGLIDFAADADAKADARGSVLRLQLLSTR
jgi:hypothetical protein